MAINKGLSDDQCTQWCHFTSPLRWKMTSSEKNSFSRKSVILNNLQVAAFLRNKRNELPSLLRTDYTGSVNTICILSSFRIRSCARITVTRQAVFSAITGKSSSLHWLSRQNAHYMVVQVFKSSSFQFTVGVDGCDLYGASTLIRIQTRMSAAQVGLSAIWSTCTELQFWSVVSKNNTSPLPL